MNYIQSVNNPKVKQWRKLLAKKERDLTRLFLVEGFHLVEEALKDMNRVVEIIISEGKDMPLNWNLDNVQITSVTDEVMNKITDTKTPQGIAAVCKQMRDDFNPQTAKSFILIDAIQDPGNLGTIIRTADAAGVDAVIVGNETADIYQPKVVRSAQGSHFHLPIIKSDLTDAIANLKAAGVKIYGTALENSKNYEEISSVDSYALIVGNEGSGVNEDILALTDENLYIPIYGKSESLNVAVATGILTYYLQSKLKKQ